MAFRRGPAPYRRRSRGFDYLLTIVILALLALVVARVQNIETIKRAGIAKIVDGDSLELNGERIRLEGIDAPEIDQTCLLDGRKQPCGREAQRRLIVLAGTGRLSCTGWQRDKYDRLLGVCQASGREVNREMVRSGWAVAYGAYRAEEGEARKARLGLWAGEFQRPQDFRRMKGDVLEPPHDFWRVLTEYIVRISGLDLR
jgi:endonuclease YncB( thermonuclease family)